MTPFLSKKEKKIVITPKLFFTIILTLTPTKLRKSNNRRKQRGEIRRRETHRRWPPETRFPSSFFFSRSNKMVRSESLSPLARNTLATYSYIEVTLHVQCPCFPGHEQCTCNKYSSTFFLLVYIINE